MSIEQQPLEYVPKVSPAGLCSIREGAKFLGVGPKKMREIARQDGRLTVVRLGAREKLIFEELQRLAAGEA